MRRRLVLLVLLLCSCSPGSPSSTATPPHIEAEEHAVYSALVRQNPVGYNLGSSVVIRQQTVAGLDMLELALENVHALPAKLVESYRSRNAAPYALGANLDLEQDYALMLEEEYKEIFDRGGAPWAKFEAKYPEARGFILFSRVGFDADVDQALVSMGFRCGDLCGAGGLYLLVKEDGNWKVQEELIVWQS
jgi:hypothetical protein